MTKPLEKIIYKCEKCSDLRLLKYVGTISEPIFESKIDLYRCEECKTLVDINTRDINGRRK